MTTFNDLLEQAGLSPRKVLLLRHKARGERLARALRLDVHGETGLFETYQGSQGLRFAARLSGITAMASFIEDGIGRAIFIGLYDVGGFRPVSGREWHADNGMQALLAPGMRSREADTDDDVAIFIDSARSARLADLSAALHVEWITRGRSWTHRADRHELPVLVTEGRQESASRRGVSWG